MFDSTVTIEKISKKDLQAKLKQQRLQGVGNTLVNSDIDARGGQPAYEQTMYQGRQKAIVERLKKARGE